MIELKVRKFTRKRKGAKEIFQNTQMNALEIG
jgi:hypothetical protein